MPDNDNNHETYKKLSSEYASVLNNMTDGILLLKSDKKKKKWIIDFMNLSFAQLNDMSYIEAMRTYSSNIYERVHPDEAGSLKEILEEAADKIAMVLGRYLG